MNTKRKIWFGLVVAAIIVAALAWWLHGHTVAVLEPRGVVGQKERNLIAFAMLLSAIVVIPVFVLTIVIAWKYRENNPKKQKYQPDWDHSRLYESIWWGIPCAIIIVLSVVTWNSSHDLDPYRNLVSAKKPLTIQVVSLDWKWLFIYPDQHVASVNQVAFPVNTPVAFQITSDTVMNSFWIPQLGSQIYAMPGMSTQLHLMADKAGSYYGSPANISGKGFAYMTFRAKALPQQQFNAWIHHAGQASKPLTAAAYAQLSKPSEANPVTYYSGVSNGLYNYIVMKYMSPYVSAPSSSLDRVQMQGMGL